MNIAYLDTDKTSTLIFERLCNALSGVHKLICCESVSDFLEKIKEERIDLVFSEAELPDGDAFALSEVLNEDPYYLHTVLVTRDLSYSEKSYASEMFGYIVKPCTAEKLHRVIERYNRKVHPIGVERASVYIKTFGRFEVFVGGEVVHFSNKKAKELLALLVDRDGGFVTMEQVIDSLWEDRAYDESTKALYRIALKNLRDTLSRAGCADILIEKRGQRCLDKKKISCDYYDFVENPKEFSHLFNDEYMIDYPWSEFTLAKIVRLNEKN